MCRRTLAIRSNQRHGERGQTLLLAIIIMLLLALVGAGFIVTVAHDMQQSDREVGMVSGKFLAEAAIRYADEQLTHSLQGADWRPTYPATLPVPTPTDTSYWDEYEIVKGWSAQGFVKYPDPRDPNSLSFGDGYVLLKVEYDPVVSRYIRLLAIGRPARMEQGEQVADTHRYWTQLAYKPVGLLDYLWFVTDKEHNPTPALLGLPWIDSNGDGVPNTDGDGILEPGEEDYLFLLPGPVRSNKSLTWNVPVQINLSPSLGERVEVAGEIVHLAGDVADVTLRNLSPGDVRVQDLDTGTVYDVNPSVSGFNTLNGSYRDHASWSADPLRQVRRLEAPDLGLDQPDPVTGQVRFDQLTRFSGTEVSGYNTGEFGYGWGIYIDNVTDRQDRLFNRNNGQFEQTATWEAVRQEWMGTEVVGSGGEELLGSWQQRTYVPPGVEIVLFDYDPTGTDGLPKIWMRRSDFEPNDPTRGRTWKAANGADTGEFVRWFNYPPNGVILAEGNIRVRGRLPLSTPNAEYNLVVVSRGIIYVEGNLLRPYDTDANTTNDNAPDAANTRIALLARDHVVINPTTFLVRTMPNPEPPDRPTSVVVPTSPDGGQWITSDPLDPHWLLDPSGVRQEFLIFDFARPNSPTPYLTVKHADQNDGPSESWADVQYPRWESNPQPPPPNTYIWRDITGSGPVRPGVQGTGNFVTAPYLPNAYAQGYRPDTWNVSGSLNPNVGIRNYIRFKSADPFDDDNNPQTPPFSPGNSYHLTNAKIERFDANGQPTAGLDFVVSAVIYAEHGTFFIIPCDWFDPSVPPVADPTNPALSAYLYARYRRYNYSLSVNGAIAMSDTPSLADVGAWSDRWSYPVWSGSAYDWGLVTYTFDRGLRAALPGGRLRFRNLPPSRDVVYVSERG
jgi:hypothetical protein